MSDRSGFQAGAGGTKRRFVVPSLASAKQSFSKSASLAPSPFVLQMGGGNVDASRASSGVGSAHCASAVAGAKRGRTPAAVPGPQHLIRQPKTKPASNNKADAKAAGKQIKSFAKWAYTMGCSESCQAAKVQKYHP